MPFFASIKIHPINTYKIHREKNGDVKEFISNLIANNFVHEQKINFTNMN